jgi:hypothetical protein
MKVDFYIKVVIPPANYAVDIRICMSIYVIYVMKAITLWMIRSQTVIVKRIKLKDITITGINSADATKPVRPVRKVGHLAIQTVKLVKMVKYVTLVMILYIITHVLSHAL